MSGSKRRSKRGRSKARIRPDPENFWREDEVIEPPDVVTATDDPTATLRSIGPPLVPGGDDASNEFLKATLRASSLVTVLAESVELTDEHHRSD